MAQPPPLPFGWTEHVGPTGAHYFYNAVTKESTYTRPLPPIGYPASLIAGPPPAKKNKPVSKLQIPGTEWLRVKTGDGKIFYSHLTEKRSVWTIPDEIQGAVEEFEKSENAQKAGPQAKGIDTEQELEIQRVKTEVAGLVKRKADESHALSSGAAKKARVTESDDESEEEWQKEAAAQLLAEAQEHERRKREQEEEEKVREANRQESAIQEPPRPDLSVEEARVLFKTLLREKDVNPLHPWDKSLPLFISDSRYTLLPSVSMRREAFDEYCRERARELRDMNVRGAAPPLSAKEEFERLLLSEVKSTKTAWNDFRRTWKKDKRFYSWGRDDREREKRFKEHMRELSERKRLAAKKAEADFFALLREKLSPTIQSPWKEVKGPLSKDPRYDAVGSSSLREELFNVYVKAQAGTSAAESDPALAPAEAAPQKSAPLDKASRQKLAVEQREKQVKEERERVEVSIGRSKQALNQDEGEREFRTLLVDAIRDPQVEWDRALPQLETDPRFNNSPLSKNHQIQLFQQHVNKLRLRYMASLHKLFEEHARSLDSTFDSMPVSEIMDSTPATRLKLSTGKVEREFGVWQRQRNTEARAAFDEMLAENSFVDFWGRLRKVGGEGADGGIKADELGEDEGEAGGGKADMKELAKSVDVSEIKKVLKNDRRYTVFDHAPEQRERWIRDYLSNLSASRLSVHVAPA